MKKLFVLLMMVVLLGSFPAAAQEVTPEPTAVSLADAGGHFVTVNGDSIYYVERGPADGPPVLLLHGFLGSTVSWTKVIDVLAEAGYRTIAFDRPPFGLSDKRTSLDYTLTAMGDLTVGLMDTLGIEQAALVGHSAGGAVIADVALRYPERVSKLVFAAAAVGVTPEDMGENGGSDEQAQLLTRLSNFDPDSPKAQALIRAFFNGSFASSSSEFTYFDPSKEDAALTALEARGIQVPGWEGGLLAFFRDNAQLTDSVDVAALAEVTIPTLLIWGEEDKVVPISVGERLRDVLPNATWIAYPETGHIVMNEANEAFNRDLLNFLAGE